MELKQWEDRVAVLDAMEMRPEVKAPLVQLVQQKIEMLQKAQDEAVEASEQQIDQSDQEEPKAAVESIPEAPAVDEAPTPELPSEFSFESTSGLFRDIPIQAQEADVGPSEPDDPAIPQFSLDSSKQQQVPEEAPSPQVEPPSFLPVSLPVDSFDSQGVETSEFSSEPFKASPLSTDDIQAESFNIGSDRAIAPIGTFPIGTSSPGSGDEIVPVSSPALAASVPEKPIEQLPDTPKVDGDLISSIAAIKSDKPAETKTESISDVLQRFTPEKIAEVSAKAKGEVKTVTVGDDLPQKGTIRERRVEALKAVGIEVPEGASIKDVLRNASKLSASLRSTDDSRRGMDATSSPFPGGHQDDVGRIGKDLNTNADAAAQDTGSLLVEMARAIAILANHVSEAKRILSEASY
jgi:hypothetical protein